MDLEPWAELGKMLLWLSTATLTGSVLGCPAFYFCWPGRNFDDEDKQTQFFVPECKYKRNKRRL